MLSLRFLKPMPDNAQEEAVLALLGELADRDGALGVTA